MTDLPSQHKENGRHIIGKGEFGWMSEERVYGRYGTIFLEPNINRAIVNGYCGTHGKLVARVIKTREPKHAGDWFMGIYPKVPKIGEEIIIGSGKLFVEEKMSKTCVGLSPENIHSIPWLNVESLYNAVDQVVELYFQEDVDGQAIDQDERDGGGTA